MRKLLAVLSCLFMSTASAQSDSPRVARETSVALWVQPVLAGPLLALSALLPSSYKFLMLPLGASVSVSPRLDWVLEVTPVYQRLGCDGDCESRALLLAVGTSWLVGPTRSRGGYFLQPKLMGAQVRESVAIYASGDPYQHERFWSATSRQLSVGLDVGYRLPSEHLVLELVLGGSVGRGWNVPSSASSAITSLFGLVEKPRTDKWVWDVNPNVLRLGGRF